MDRSTLEEASGESKKHQSRTPELLQRAGSGASAGLGPPVAGCIEAESRKMPSSQFKGVVPQPNGRWGAQIYEKHQRVWLGTFNEEPEAALAYDVAAQRFRGRDAITNCKTLSESEDADAAELAFLHSRSKAEIVDMLRKHTYRDELEQSRRAHKITHGCGGAEALRETPRALGAEREREQLFEKAVTPSDVGKLNRLVIPKQHAEKHFPLQGGSSAAGRGVLLKFEDGCGKEWRFRYSYWNSSQSYVLTKGWSRFVKEKGLKAGDVVSFLCSTGPEKQLYIDRKAQTVILPIQVVRPAPIVRLFGVNISSFPMAIGGDGMERSNGVGGWDGKRTRDMLLTPPPRESIKKPCIGAF